MKLRHAPKNSGVMIGMARTLQLGRPNDFLAVLVALTQLSAGDVLVVNTGGSTRAVAGSLFTTEATRRGVSGIVVDGPIRDVNELDCFAYSTKITPYAGTVQHIGEGVDASSIQCAGVTVNPGDIVFGDSNGILVGSVDTFSTCLHDAEHIVAAEQRLIEGMKLGVSLHSMINFDEHFAARKEGRESSLTVCSKSKQWAN
jgi:4-hydroxy-4-methyl-2-oxoglutarate aldolase